MRNTFVAVLCLLTCSCTTPVQWDSHVFYAAADSVRRYQRDNMMETKYRADREAFRTLIGEPDIKISNYPSYQFAYSMAFGPSIILRVEQMPDATFRLTSKMIRSFNVYPWVLKIPHREIKIESTLSGTTKNQLLFTTEQKISKKEWTSFLNILNGSFYWTFENPMPDDGILDGDGLSLFSKSRIPRTGKNTLIYHENYVHCPIISSYTNAFEYLVRESNLLQQFGIKALIRYRN